MWKCKKCGNSGFKKEYDITKTEYALQYDKNGKLIDLELDHFEDIILMCDECENFTRSEDIVDIAKWVEKEKEQ